MLVMSPSAAGMTPAALKARMKANGVENANQLANLLGVNRSTVGRWLSGKRRIDIKAAALIREHLPTAR